MPEKSDVKLGAQQENLMGRVLIIDDEKLLGKQLYKLLNQEGYNVYYAPTGKEGIGIARSQNPDAVLLDLKLPDMDGLEVLKALNTLDPPPNTIMMTAHGNIELAVSAIKLGAYDFIEKPFTTDKLKVIVRNALKASELKNTISITANRGREKYGFDALVGRSEVISGIVSILKKLSSTDPRMVLITGESGTGKGIAARILHYNGVRASKPFIEINCAAIPEKLLESELFGYEAGAFTDAKKTKKGMFELAHGGTIFLDEIGDMDLTLQAKLVKAIEERTFRRIGGVSDISVDVRIIAATNRDLKQLVSSGLFRADLYHRLNVIQIHMPPLRERKEDIPLLTDYFLNLFNHELHRNIRHVPDSVREALLRYHWPGNIRELRSTIERAVILSEGDELNPRYIRLEEDGDDIKVEQSEDGMTLKIVFEETSLPKIEEAILKETLERANWNQSKAAKMLGISRDAVRYRMKKLGLLK